jgi:hypothetical protein
MLFAVIAASLFKWIPGSFGYALAQDGPSAVLALLQAIIAAIVWGGGICLALSFYRVVFFSARRPSSRYRPSGSLVTGLAAGFATSLILTAFIIFGFQQEGLLHMGWIDGPTYKALIGDSSRLAGPYLYDVFVTTRCGWAYLVIGSFLGLGMALDSNALFASQEFGALRSSAKSISVPGLDKEQFWEISLHLWHRFRGTPLMLTVGAAITIGLLHKDVIIANHTGQMASLTRLSLNVLFDSCTQMIGAFFAIVGMGLGLVLTDVRSSSVGDSLQSLF